MEEALSTEKIINRFSKVIGHMNATKRMVENNRDRYDILIQLSAVEAATKSLRKVMLRDYISYSVTNRRGVNNYGILKRLNTSIDQMLK
ncbi:MAG: metal-sensing transcriptional repressor [Clostridiales bacterium]|nr:metal-sensing transcriptional repressor [Clostridiales bacterium]MBS5877074.1 metal-sensing transcriptional repressor [Clostridiales bacterium]MDU0939081.1 metal-sensing transcriptional repressor [Clostridiales bacterium]MDU1041784.1 metal-sensing transcriptional repressor [Clostridiales bacterium]MDU3489601.1 metal-sensing transcriptional repressor [Clostridiales bacterium]